MQLLARPGSVCSGGRPSVIYAQTTNLLIEHRLVLFSPFHGAAADVPWLANGAGEAEVC